MSPVLPFEGPDTNSWSFGVTYRNIFDTFSAIIGTRRNISQIRVICMENPTNYNSKKLASIQPSWHTFIAVLSLVAGFTLAKVAVTLRFTYSAILTRILGFTDICRKKEYQSSESDCSFPFHLFYSILFCSHAQQINTTLTTKRTFLRKLGKIAIVISRNEHKIN